MFVISSAGHFELNTSLLINNTTVLLLPFSLPLCVCSCLLLASVNIYIFLNSRVYFALKERKIMHDLCLNTAAEQLVLIIEHGLSSVISRNDQFQKRN